jgi:hypothetical protein
MTAGTIARKYAVSAVVVKAASCSNVTSSYWNSDTTHKSNDHSCVSKRRFSLETCSFAEILIVKMSPVKATIPALALFGFVTWPTLHTLTFVPFAGLSFAADDLSTANVAASNNVSRKFPGRSSSSHFTTTWVPGISERCNHQSLQELYSGLNDNSSFARAFFPTNMSTPSALV